MKLYVANCTQQVQDFIYRLPENPGVRTQKIEIGGQIRVAGDLTTPEIDAVIAQHAKYGLVAADVVDRTKPFIGLCYAVDKPINVDRVRRALIHNVEVLNDRGAERRKEAAIFTSNEISNNQAVGPALTALEMSIEEKPAPGQDVELGKQEVRVTRVEPEGRGPAPGRSARASRERRAA